MENTLISNVVKQDLCVGCGLCTMQCPEGKLSMVWNDKGFLIPELNGECKTDCSCITVCPFNPIPEETVRTEDELTKLFLPTAPKYHLNIGSYFNMYVGYSKDFRLTSSSGGLATYLISKLLEGKYVDAVFTLREGKSKDSHYEYSIIRNSNDALLASKTKYYPVTLAEVMKQLDDFDGKVAIVGIACFIKAVRLYQHYNPAKKEKISFLIGIICGGLKSRYFAEYLAGKAGVVHDKFSKPLFRIKDLEGTAPDYSFGCNDEKERLKTIKMRKVGDMWGTSMFKNNACDFCDDVAAELADISLGDAWLDPYRKDGRGTSIIVTRTKLADILINQGKDSGELILDDLPVRSFIYTQLGSFYHRYYALRFRIQKASKEGFIIPPKRHSNYGISLDFKRVQVQRIKIGKLSLELWPKLKSAEKFDEALREELNRLNKRTKTYHLIRRIKKRFLKKWQY